MIRIIALILALTSRLVAAPQATPTFSAVYPNAAQPGATNVSITLRGNNLQNVTSASFTGGTGTITVQPIVPGTATATNLPLVVSFAGNVSLGLRSIFLTTPTGNVTFIDVFSVISGAPPVINPITSLTAAGLSRSVAQLYSPAFTLTVNGQSFVAGAVLLVTPATGPQVVLTPTAITPTQLTVPISDSVLGVVGIRDVAVRESVGGTTVKSNTVPLRIIPRGDIDGNGTITTLDSREVALNAGEVGVEAPLGLSVGDIDLNGTFNVTDALDLELFMNANPSLGTILSTAPAKVVNLPTPVILPATPTSATAGQQFTITATGLPPTSADLEVVFRVASGAIVERLRAPDVVLDPPPANKTQSASLHLNVPASAVSGYIQIFRLDSPMGSQPYPLTVTGTNAPVLLTSTPLKAAVNTSATLTGSNFDTGVINTVKFKSAGGTTDVNAIASVDTPGSLTVTVPNDAICGPVSLENRMAVSNSKPFITGAQTCALSLTGLWSASGPGKMAILEGTGFNALNPQANSVTFPTSGGTAPAAVLQAGPTELHIRIPDNAIPGNVTVTVGASTANISYQPFAPTISRINPNNSAQNPISQVVVPVTIDGSGFVQGATQVTFTTPTPPTVGAVTFVSATRVTTTFTINTTTSIQKHTVKVATPGGSATAFFEVLGPPTITSVSPRDVDAFTTREVTITGTGFAYPFGQSAGTTLTVAADGSVSNPNIANPTSMKANVFFNYDGFNRTEVAQVTTAAGISTAFEFTNIYINDFDQMTPTQGFSGEAGFQVQVTGCFPSNSFVTVTGGGVNVGSLNLNQENLCAGGSATANLSVQSNANPGVRTVRLTSPTVGTFTSGTSFTVFLSKPILTSITPNFGSRNSTITNVHVQGDGFVPGFVSMTIPGVTISNIFVFDRNNLDATFTVSAGAPIGPQNATVTVSGRTSDPLVGGFTILDVPTIASFTPSTTPTTATAYVGGPLYMTFTGTGYLPPAPAVAGKTQTAVKITSTNVSTPGTTVTITNSTGITIGTPTISGDFSTLKVDLAILSNVTLGARTLTITTPAGSVTRTINFVAPPAAPTLTDVSPSSGPANGFLTVTLTGTNLINGGTTVNFSGGGANVSNFNDGFVSSTQMTAFFGLLAAGNYTVSVTTAGGTSATKAFTVTANALAGAAHYAVSHFAGPIGGSGTADDNGINARFNNPQRIWRDGPNLYVADGGNHTIRKVVIATGATSTIAGLPGVSGSAEGAGSVARFNSPTGIWGDGTNLYVTDSGNNTIRKIVLATGVVSTIAGSAVNPPALVDNQVGLSARFNNPRGICGDGPNLYIADSGNNVIRKYVINTTAVSIVAGSLAGASGPNDGSATATARFFGPQGVYCEGTNIYVADGSNNEIRKFDVTANSVTTIAGSTTPGSADGTGGVGGTARFSAPSALWSDLTYLYVSDGGNNKIRKVTISNGLTSTLAGSVAGSDDGTGGPAGTARFFVPRGVWGAAGDLYVADGGNNTIRKINLMSEAVTTFAGSPSISASVDAVGTAARFLTPAGLTGDDTNLYSIDRDNARIRQVALSNAAVSTLTGTNGLGFQDGTAAAAQYSFPDGVWNDGANLYTADTNNSAIRKLVLATGVTSTIPGVVLNNPRGIWGDGVFLYIADTENHRIRRIEIATNAATTIAGTGLANSTDGIGVLAAFRRPSGLWSDGTYLYIADSENHTIRRLDLSTMQVITIAGNPSVSATTDGIGTAARFMIPWKIWGDRTHLYVADPGSRAIRKIQLSNFQVTTIAGGHSGSEDGLDRNAAFGSPSDIWGNGSDLYVTDALFSSLRKVTPAILPAPTLTSIAGTSGTRGTTVAVILTGANYLAGTGLTQVNVDGTGVSVPVITVTGPGRILANFLIDPAAGLGAHNVTVQVGAQMSTSVTFTVN